MSFQDTPILPQPDGGDWRTWAAKLTQVLFLWFGRLASLAIPPGTVFPFLGSVIPAGYLELNGQVVSQETYRALYLVIGAAYNTGGEGAGNFRLPDAAGRVFMQDTVNLAGGNDTMTLTLANLPDVAITVTETGHSHSVQSVLAPSGSAFVASGSTPITTGTTVTRVSDQATTGLSARLPGGGQAFSLKPKYFGGRWIIKT